MRTFRSDRNLPRGTPGAIGYGRTGASGFLLRFAPQRLAHRTRKRSPDLSLALTPPLPEGEGE
jgi:hypothetical protein